MFPISTKKRGSEKRPSGHKGGGDKVQKKREEGDSGARGV